MVWTVLGHGLHIYLSELLALGVHVGECPSLAFSCDEHCDQKQLEVKWV